MGLDKHFDKRKDQNVSGDMQKLEETNRELAKVNQQLKRKVAELSFLYDVATNLMKSYDLNSLLESTLEMALKITNTEVGCILLIDLLPEARFKVKLDTGGLEPEVKNYLTNGCPCLNSLVNKPKILTLRHGDERFLPIRQFDPSLRSLLAVPLLIENKVIGIVIIMHRHFGDDEHLIDFSHDDRRTLSIFAQQAALILENTRLKIEHVRKDMYLKTIAALTSAIDAKDVYTQNHSRRVADLSVGLARELQLTEDEVIAIGYGATLHDVGKIGINELILNKKGKLSNEEFELIKAHPLIGAKILEPIDFLMGALDIVRHHHERYDGTGYPDGLKGEAIPYTARIVGIADAWDAMTSNRSYRHALSYEHAIQELHRGSGTQFDPYLVKSFIKLVEKNKFSYPEVL